MSSKLATWQHCKFSGLSAFQGAACKRQMCHGNGNGIPRCCDSLRRSWPIFLGWPYLVAFLGRNLCGRLFWFEISFLNLFWIIVWFLVNPGNKVNENGGLKSALFPLCPLFPVLSVMEFLPGHRTSHRWWPSDRHGGFGLGLCRIVAVTVLWPFYKLYQCYVYQYLLPLEVELVSLVVSSPTEAAQILGEIAGWLSQFTIVPLEFAAIWGKSWTFQMVSWLSW